jgi:hypothetical protein
VRQGNPPSILPQQLFVLSLDLPFPNNSLVFEAAELIEAMEKQITELDQQNMALRSVGGHIRSAFEHMEKSLALLDEMIGVPK